MTGVKQNEQPIPNNQQQEFENVVRPVMKWLAENQHPHTHIIITSTDAELSEGVNAISTSEYLPD